MSIEKLMEGLTIDDTVLNDAARRPATQTCQYRKILGPNKGELCGANVRRGCGNFCCKHRNGNNHKICNYNGCGKRVYNNYCAKHFKELMYLACGDDDIRVLIEERANELLSQ